jgi:ppGpp synthetase/RelA/SpoT-type nucleotidyltranferase
MKISASIRRLYQDQVEQNKNLKGKVDGILRSIASQRNWHYESRIKSEISVALKLESGRIKDPREIEDFFACTLVVRNLSEISEAEGILKAKFKIVERRPPDIKNTQKYAEAFPFDDIRIYAHWKDNPIVRTTGLENIRFEAQIKTFLQHAWGIATHDLVYKTDDVSWSRQRIAFQIKAMLEHAEISIQEANRLAETTALRKTHKKTEELREIIQLLKEIWNGDFLPDDLRRLAENTRNVMTLADIKVSRLKELIEEERKRQKGNLPINISPYSIIVQSVVWHEPGKLRSRLIDKQRKEKLFLTDEMEVPDWMKSKDMINIIRI